VRIRSGLSRIDSPGFRQVIRRLPFVFSGTCASAKLRKIMNQNLAEQPHEKPIRVGGRNLGPVRHICAFFHSKEEEYTTLRDFIKEGIEAGEKGFHIVDSKHCAT